MSTVEGPSLAAYQLDQSLQRDGVYLVTAILCLRFYSDPLTVQTKVS